MNGNRCVIIGSGSGGLSTGVILARNSLDVTVSEQHSLGTPGVLGGGMVTCPELLAAGRIYQQIMEANK